MKRRLSSSRTPPGQRQLRVGERIRHILADVLRRGDLHDPVLAQASLITVTAVEIGPDLKHATAYIMPLGGKNAESVVQALNRASGYFRTEIGRELDLHSTPKISFRIDESFENAAHIESLLRQDRVRKDVTAEEDDD
jgi:ribosome-binding factor A